VLLLAGRSNGASHDWLDGTTSQGGHVQVETDGDKPMRIFVDVPMHCPGGSWRITWAPRGELKVRDGRLRVTETATRHYRFHNQTGRRTMTLDARVGDGTVDGTVTSVEHFDEPGYGPYDCSSGRLTFSARAG
jgi:hypothetical protein